MQKRMASQLEKALDVFYRSELYKLMSEVDQTCIV